LLSILYKKFPKIYSAYHYNIYLSVSMDQVHGYGSAEYLSVPLCLKDFHGGSDVSGEAAAEVVLFPAHLHYH
jgi:hypothetical protein